MLFDLDIVPRDMTLDKIRFLILEPKSGFCRRGQKFAAFSFFCRVSHRNRRAPISPNVEQIERTVEEPRLLVASDNAQRMREPSKIKRCIVGRQNNAVSRIGERVDLCVERVAHFLNGRGRDDASERIIEVMAELFLEKRNVDRERFTDDIRPGPEVAALAVGNRPRNIESDALA